jgi:hypothetical protein
MAAMGRFFCACVKELNEKPAPIDAGFFNA